MTESEVAAGALGALAGIAAAVAAYRGTAARAPRPAAVPDPAPHRDDAELAARLLSALPFAAFLVDAGGRVRMVNAAAETLFDIDARRAPGHALIEVVPSLDLERMVDAALKGEIRTKDIVFGSGDRQRQIGVTVRPYDAGAMAIAADRTEYLAGERVRRDFTGNVSHELKTPLSAIKLMLETVMLSDDDAEARALFLPQIAQEVERMIRIVEDLLELARSESAILSLRRERFDLGELAGGIANTFAARADAQEVDLVVDAPDAVGVDADRGRLTQVVVNLVDNALRHTPRGGRVTIVVGAERGEAVLSVADTGVGIPYGDLSRIFERFYVVDRSRARERTGTGLGLAIAKHLVEAHGGTIGVRSSYGEGATFTVRLPGA